MDLSADWPYIEQIAARRLAHNRTQYHVADPNYPWIEVLGAAGELAARRFLELPEALHEYFDNGVDIVWRGWPVDVKTTRKLGGMEHCYLQWPVSKPVKAELIMMAGVNLDDKDAEILGFVFRHDVLSAPVNYERKWPCREIPVRQLNHNWLLKFIPWRKPGVDTSRYNIFA